MLSEHIKPLKGLAPAADRFNTGPGTDWFNTKLHEEITFIVYHQGGTTGKAKLQVEMASDASGTGATAVPFSYRRMTTGDSDALGSIGAATAADGIETVPGEDTLIEVNINCRALPDEAKTFVRLKTTETADDPVNACIFAFGHGPLGRSARYVSNVSPTALA